jgi:hypothetical protein
MSERNFSFRVHLAFSGVLLSLSVLILLATATVAGFSLETYRAICICTVNFLAYSWIAFAVHMLFALTAMVWVICMARHKQPKGKSWALNLLAGLQALAFMAGIVLLIIFLARLTEVV